MTLVPSCRDFHAGLDLDHAIQKSKSTNWPVSLSRRHGGRAEHAVAAFPQSSSRLRQTAAGGHHIVDHDHHLTRHDGRDSKGILQISGTLISAEACLIADRSRLAQQPARSDRTVPSEYPSSTPRQGPGRVEAALTHSCASRRHRNEHHGVRMAGR